MALRAPALREVLEGLDVVDVTRIFSLRGVVMEVLPKFLLGLFQNALKFALAEATAGVPDQESVRQTRKWKLLLIIPRLLLHRSPGGRRILKRKLVERFEKFSHAQWHDLIRDVRAHCVMRKELCPDDGPITKSMIWRCEQRERRCWFSWATSLSSG